MNVAEIMTPYPDTLDADTSIRQAAILMRDGDYGVVPIVDENGSLVGIVTDRDLVVKAVADGHGSETPIRDCMTTAPDTIAPDTPVEYATQLMAKKQIRRLAVVENGRLVGMLSLSDIATSSETDHKKADTLAEISVKEETQATTSSFSEEKLPGV